jgi:ABC-type multidrug transport system fused ATPase/permease subunit
MKNQLNSNNNINKLNEYIELPNISNENNLNILNSKLIDSDSELITEDSDLEINKNEQNKKNIDKNESILIDNINIKLLDIKNYHKQIGYVCQEPPLFNTTILENILYGIDENSQKYDKNEIEKVIKMAKADFVFDTNLFPKGLETIVGEKGSQLSGGQKQRIAIARALIKKPKILILDEATSALDAESEYEIQNQIYNLSKDMNIIIVAHRLSSIKNCDKIIVIEHGKIVESGTHQELINMNGKYKELMEKQMNNSNK